MCFPLYFLLSPSRCFCPCAHEWVTYLISSLKLPTLYFMPPVKLGVDRISIEKAGNCVNLRDLWSPKHHVPNPGPLRSCKFSLCESAWGTIRGQASPQRLLLKEGRLFPFRNQGLEPDVAWERCAGFMDRAPYEWSLERAVLCPSCSACGQLVLTHRRIFQMCFQSYWLLKETMHCT